MDPREYDWQMGDLADQSNYPPGVDPSAIGTAVKNWWSNQPSWAERAKAENQRTAEVFQRGGMGAIAQQLATDTTEAQDLAGGFGGNIKGVKPPVVPGALAAADQYRPPFYSAVEQAVQGAKQNVALGQQWAGFLRNQPGVKPEEVEALGLSKLFEQPGAVQKQDLLGQIAANKVNVGEAVKGGERPANWTVTTAGGPISENPTMRFATEEAAQAELAKRQQEFPNAYHDVAELPTMESKTKFSQYTLPGGENYREMLLTLPSADAPKAARMTALEGKLRNAGDYDYHEVDAMRAEYKRLADETRASGTFQSPHYDEPNILAHVRYNDRVIDGKKTLFVEEVQSDWHQKGKREGYTNPEERQTLVDKISRGETLTAEEEARRVSLMKGGSVPDAPFKSTWPELAMKRIIREAAEKGYDKVAWTPGSVQAERYDLSKHVDGIQVSGRTDARTGDKSHGALVRMRNGQDLSVGYGKDGIIDNTGASNTEWKGKHLSDVFGKDIAQKMVEGKSVFDADLKIGGEGMKGFYDEILPATVNKLVKKHGGRVQEGKMFEGSPEKWEPVRTANGDFWQLRNVDDGYRGSQEFATKQQAYDFLSEGKSHGVHSLDITPSLRAAAMKGFPLFSAGGIAATGAIGELARQDEYQ